MWKLGFAPSDSLRHRIYLAVAIGFFVLAVGMAASKAILLKQRFSLVVSDGRYYYAYLPSVLIDGDLDFSNQIAENWGTDFRSHLLDDRTSTGAVQNKYPIGLALTLLPGFVLGHVVSMLSFGFIPADGYSWPYQVCCLAIVELLVWRMLVRVDRLLTERFGVTPAHALLGLVTLAIATHYVYYACREPFMVHAVSAFWCVEVVSIVAAANRANAWFLPRITFCWAMAIVCRPTNVHLAPVVILGIATVIQSFGLRRLLVRLPFVVLALAPIALQMTTWRLLSGNWVHYSYGAERFDWAHPALWETLFSSRHGLFFWSPICLLAVFGLALRARDALIQCWFLGAVLLWYFNSAWHCWWFGDAFGARSFLELSGLFAIGLALIFSRWRDKPSVVWAICVISFVFNLTMMALYITHTLPRDGYLLSS